MILAGKLFEEYRNELLSNKGKYIEDYNEVRKKVEKSPAKYHGKPVKFLYQPMFFDSDDMKVLKNAGHRLMKILKKVIAQYLKDEEFRKAFDFSPILEKLILKNAGYNVTIPMARFDILYYPNGDFKFIELNADGSSGMLETRELQNIFEESLIMDKIKKDYEIEGFELFNTWVDGLLANYREFSGGDNKPNIAIVDRLLSGIPNEFVAFQKAFEKRGYSTIIADIRELEYRDKRLYHKDFPIDCIYRRAVTWEIVEKPEETQDFIQAYLDGAVCVVGPILTQIIHNKNIFSILHDSTLTKFLSGEDRDFIKNHIPYTGVFNNNDEEMVDYVLKNKDGLVLKPMDKYASYGVSIGQDFNMDQWQDIIKNQAVDGYLFQKFCKLPNRHMPIVHNGDIKFVNRNYVLGLYLYNEKFQGIYTRTSEQNVVGVIGEFAAVPNYAVNKKL
ncbi:MAG: glutathionylspermidine synthase family protein [Clostridiales bacterium]|nr:glutathionylspermidine synthase family protein [Clostridiales bacterium]